MVKGVSLSLVPSSGTLFRPGCGVCQMYHRLRNIWRHTFISNSSQYLRSVWTYQKNYTSWKHLEAVGILRDMNMWHDYIIVSFMVIRVWRDTCFTLLSFSGGGGGSGLYTMSPYPTPCTLSLHTKRSLTSVDCNSECACISSISDVVRKDVGNGRHADGEEVARCRGPGDQVDLAWYVDSRGFSVKHLNTGVTQLNGAGNIRLAGDCGRRGVDWIETMRSGACECNRKWYETRQREWTWTNCMLRTSFR